MSKKKIDLKREWFDREEEDEEEYVVPERKFTLEDKEQILHLKNLKRTSDLGLVDLGFPVAYHRLSINGWAKKEGNGYQITEEGRAYLATISSKVMRSL